MPVCDCEDKVRFKFEKNEDDDSFGFDGMYGSASSTATGVLLAPFVAGGVCGCDLGGCVGVGAGRSGVGEDLELNGFIHDDRFDPLDASWLTLSELVRLNRLGRFGSGGCCCLLGVGVCGYAFVVSLAGSTGVGGVTFGNEGSLILLGSEREVVMVFGVRFP